MRVHEFGPPESLSWDDVDTPTPGPGEALVRVRAVGVNRVDIEMRSGIYGKVPIEELYGDQSMVFPFTPGIEPTGVVEAVGEGVEVVAIGDRVIPHAHLSCGECANCLLGFDNACDKIEIISVQIGDKGGYSEYFTWPADLLLPLPDEIGFEEGAALLVNYGPVWNGLVERARIRPGETLLITGASGGCGHAAIEVGLLAGARVLGLGGSDEKLAELEVAGAVAIDYRGGFAEAVADATKGAGADIVLDLVGGDTWEESIASVASRGRVVVIGAHGGVRTSLDLALVLGKNIEIHGVTRYSRAIASKLIGLTKEGTLKPKATQSFPLAEAAKAHRLVEGRSHIGKIVLTV